MTVVPSHIERLRPYVPGKPIEETEREIGITGVAKLASNENPLGPSPRAAAAVREAVAKANLYPDGSCFYLKRRLAEALGVGADEIAIGNGSNELIELMVRTFLFPIGTKKSGGDDEAVIADGSFIVYRLALSAHGVKLTSVPLRDRTFDLEAMADAVNDHTRMIFVANPNNPTGTFAPRAAVERFLDRVPSDVIVVLDEAYFEYVTDPDYPDGLELRKKHPNLVVLRTFSKIHGLAGLRVGYGVMPPELVGYIDRVRAPFNVNSLGQVAAIAALDDTEHVEKSRKMNAEGLAFFAERLPEIGVPVTPSVANFVLVDLGRPVGEVFEACLHEGVIIRPMAGYGFPESARVSVGLPEENERLVKALAKVLGR